MNEVVTLQQILDNREARADFQKILLRGYGSALVKQRAVCNLHTRKRDNCGLIVEQSLQATLRNLRLIWGV